MLMDIQSTVKGFKAGRGCAINLLMTALEKIKATKELNAFISVTESLARKQAEASRRRYQSNAAKGLLDGIIVAVKDNFCTKDIKTTCASMMLKNFVAPYDATVVSRLQNRGAIIIGKTNMDEFAMGCGSTDGIFGPVINPWGREGQCWWISGGSSGGSAVSVACGMSHVAIGSDTGGSVRNPASYCGVLGLKPTYGRISRHGLIPLVNSLDVPGIFARDVNSAAAVLDALSGADELDSTSAAKTFLAEQVDNVDLSALRVGVPSEFYEQPLQPSFLTTVSRLISFLGENCRRVGEISVGNRIVRQSVPCYSVLCAAEVSSNMARYDGIRYGYRDTQPGSNKSSDKLMARTRQTGFNSVVRQRIAAGNLFLLSPQSLLVQARKVRRLVYDDFQRVFADFDVLVTPTVLTDGIELNEFVKSDNRARAEQDVFTQAVNLAGLPALSVPVGLSERGLPISVQLISNHWREDVLLSVARLIQRHFDQPVLPDS